MKKELLWAACLSAVLGAGVLLLAGGNDPQGEPWKPLNDQLQTALAVQEGTLEFTLEDGKEEQPVQKETSEVPAASPAKETANANGVVDNAAYPVVQGTDQASAAAEPALQSTAAAPVDDGKIHINSADAAALMELPGIGEKKAQAILDYRAQNGPFRNVTDIVKVKGIGAKMLEKMLPDLAL
ncbi:ComEA family DNA-binding protein [Saccharibacillus sacchari]|uniref:ComEA family DNA-binding protein n=1 Tax=Saccharibacillus sacchari TaxID=456493 RepID=UPI0004B4C649|nr:helix-hairpin-helix domain-containing protein [Saccharibacillus sacchari]